MSEEDADSANSELEDLLFENGSERAVRGLEQNVVPALPVRRKSELFVGRFESAEEIDLGSGDELEVDARRPHGTGQLGAPACELVWSHGGMVVPEMRRRSDLAHAPIRELSGQRKCLIGRRRAVVDAWKEVAVEVDHRARCYAPPGEKSA